MKLLLSVLLLVLIAFIAYLFWQGYQSKSGQALGLSAEGQLHRCGDKPNCVCSEFAEDSSHFIAPLPLAGLAETEALSLMKTRVIEAGGVVVSETPDYLAATFTSALFGFVDDVEFRVDSVQGLIQMRSASRVGYSDLDANRKRVTALVARYKASD